MTSARPNHVQTVDDAEALVLGLGMFATGGGGLAERGMGYMRDLLDDGIPVEWASLDRVGPATLTCSVYGMGSIAPHPPMDQTEMQAFGVTGEMHRRPWLRAVEELEAFLGEPIGAVVPFELGPSNTLVAVDAAARAGRLLIDGDYIGRALPKMSQALPALLGLDTWPLAICDPWGNSLILKDCPSPQVAERIGKMVSRVTKAVDMGASCSHAAFPNTAASIANALVPGTLTRCLAVGRRIMDARADGRDPVREAALAVGGALLFIGGVAERQWSDSAEGYMEGTTVIEGSGSFTGDTTRIWFQNEHHLMWRGEVPVAMSPDIIAVIDARSAEPISNTMLEVGRQVAVVGLAAAAPYREGVPLEATSPRHYGFDLDWEPIERLNPESEFSIQT